MNIKSSGWRTWHRFNNRRMDALAVLRGYCNNSPKGSLIGIGGYLHWRCALLRGHSGPHRSDNYVWDTEVRYEPEDWRKTPGQRQAGKRHGIPTLRQQRLIDKVIGGHMQESRARRYREREQ